MKLKASVTLTLLLAAAVSQATAAQLDNTRASQVINTVKTHIHAQHSTGCVAVVDASGTLLAFQRLDGASPGCVDAAIGKARTSALYRTPSLKFMQRLQHGETTVLAIPHAVALGGGFPLTLQGDVVGAVGVSTPQQELDNQVAEAAAQGLK
ncbi:heme-binding protein [Erwiniaceae bacterium CAU 1747]